MRKLGSLVVILTMLGAGGYVFVYLYRWEWLRALVAIGIFLAAEVAVAAGLILRRVSRAGGAPRASGDSARDAVTATGDGVDPRVLHRLQEAPASPTPFRWLGPRHDATSVFIPVLLGAGVVVTGLAWLVEKFAAATARPGTDSGLARDLTEIGLPPDGLVVDDAALLASGDPEVDQALRQLLGPSGGAR